MSNESKQTKTKYNTEYCLLISVMIGPGVGGEGEAGVTL
jgi:hypothetical protein